MATNLEYIYRLKDQYSKKMATMIAKQDQFIKKHAEATAKISKGIDLTNKKIGKQISAFKNVNSTMDRTRQRVRENTTAFRRHNTAITQSAQKIQNLQRKNESFFRSSREGLESVNRKWQQHRHAIATRGGFRGGGAGGRAGGAGGFAADRFAKGREQMGTGRGMLGSAIAGIASIALPLKAFSDYEQAFKDVKKAVNATTEELDVLFKAGKKFRGATAEEYFAVLTEAGKADIPIDQIERFTASMIKGSKAMDLMAGETTEQVSKIISMTGQSGNFAKAADQIMDQVTNLENNLEAVKVPAIIDTWKRASSDFSALGWKNEEMSAMSAMLNQWAPTSRLAASSFGIMLDRFKKTNKKFGFFTKLKTEGIGALPEVMKHIAKMDPTKRIETFGSEADAILEKMTDPKNMEKIAKALTLSETAKGAVEQEWKLFRGTFEERWNDFKKTFKNMMVSFGKAISPTVTVMFAWAEKFFKKIQEFGKENKFLVKTIGGVVIAITGLLAVGGLLAIAIAGWNFALGGLASTMVLVKGLQVGYSIIMGFSTGLIHGNTSALFMNKAALVGAMLAVVAKTTALVVFKGVLLAAKFAISGVTIAMKLLNLAWKLSPIGLIVTLVIGLVTAFVLLHKKTGSVSGAFMAMGQIILKSLLVPTNLMIEAVIMLLQVASKIPGIGGHMKKAADGLDAFQDKMNETLTGSKGMFDFGGVIEHNMTPQKRAEAESQRLAEKRRKGELGVTVNGEVGVKAEPGTKVTRNEMDFGFNLGGNLAF